MTDTHRAPADGRKRVSELETLLGVFVDKVALVEGFNKEHAVNTAYEITKSTKLEVSMSELRSEQERMAAAVEYATACVTEHTDNIERLEGLVSDLRNVNGSQEESIKVLIARLDRLEEAVSEGRRENRRLSEMCQAAAKEGIHAGDPLLLSSSSV